MKMQVLINDQWEYVFCRNVKLDTPVTTDNKNKAITWHSHSIGYFTKLYANLQFRGK